MTEPSDVEAPNQSVVSQYLLTPPSTSMPVTAATSVQTFVPMDDEKGDTDPQGEGERSMLDEQQGAAKTPAIESIQAQPPVPQTPQTSLTFLLVSGRRRTMSFEPETTVGRVKELVWNTWPSEWQDDRPPAPSYLRILYLGKILQDEDTLVKLSFPISTPPAIIPPTIVHLSIRPSFATPDGDDAALKKKSRRGMSRTTSTVVSPGTTATDMPGGEDAESGCSGCCVIC